jgi:predicted AlkP superfamily pyrophosphatase or phosphodiesterase
MRLSLRAGVLLLALCCLSLPAPAAAPSPPPEKKPAVRLAVLVVFDQMRGDYLTRWKDLYAKDGFRRLLDDGAWFQNCHYPYAFTVTGAGHASLATGCSPRTHGIIANNWYDRKEGEVVYCAASSRYKLVPAPAPDPAEKKTKRTAGNPDRLLAATLGDTLKTVTKGKGKVVSLSLKDRSAVLPGGRRPDACYWQSSRTGSFVTSTFYRDRLHPWVERFNRQRLVDSWSGKQWQRLRPDLDYGQYSGPDDVAGEGKGFGQGRTFPHPLGSLKKSPKNYYAAVYNSPFGNEVLLGLVKEAIVAEKLGSRDVPDLLCVSFSSNDPIGHCWGPDSQEVLDVTLRSDLIVRDLLAFLDDKVGKGRYVLALSADHGVCPLPEVSVKHGVKARRLSPLTLALRAEMFLGEKFGKPQESKGGCIESVADDQVYLNRAWLKARGLKSAEVEKALADWLKQQTGIRTAYTRTELLRGVSKDDKIGQAVRRSFHPDRSGDVVPVLEPYYLFLPALSTGTTHGTPHDYDTHVPLLVYGGGVRRGVRKEAVTPQAAVPILAHALGIRPPATCEAGLPQGLFEEP